MEKPRVVLAAAAAHSNFISVGFTQGFSGIMLPQLELSDEESSWIASLGVAMTPIGALLSGLLVDYFGRKKSLLIPNIPFIISWLLIGMSTDIQLMCVGRALSGIAAGMVPTAYLYVSEIASKNHRGTLSACGPIFVSVGVLAVYTLGFIMDWKTVAYISALTSFFSIIAVYFVPESPQWLISKKENEKALEVLQWLRRDDKVARHEFLALEVTFREKNKDIQTEISEENIVKRTMRCLKGLFDSISRPEVYKPFVILVFYFLLQELSGIYILLFYAVDVLKDLGTDYDNNIIVVSMGIMRLITAMIGAFLMTKFGRRPLSIFSGAAMSLSLFIICVYFLFESYLKDHFHFIPVFGVFLHVGFSMTGFLQIPWVLNGELFPSHCRGIMTGVTGSMAYLFIFISIKTYPGLIALIHIQGVLWFFFLSTTVGVIILAFSLPETKDKTLLEISDSFSEKKKNDTAAV